MSFLENIVPAANRSYVAEFLSWMSGDADPAEAIQQAVAQVVQQVALPVFALIDAAYHTLAAALKLPFVALKTVVAKVLGFSGVIPDSLGSPEEWLGHAKKAFAAAMTVISSLTLGLVSQDAVVSLCDKLGLKYTWLTLDQLNEVPQNQRTSMMRVRGA